MDAKGNNQRNVNKHFNFFIRQHKLQDINLENKKIKIQLLNILVMIS